MKTQKAPAPAARPRRDSVDFELVGTLLGGRYRVREILGQGGMGTVYEALREELGNLVAIKVLHPNQLQKKDSVQRFHHEARAAARIGHPNICEVYDVGTLDDGRPYLVMDRLVGVTLAEKIQTSGGLPFQEVIDTLTQVLSGLHAAHEKGIIHRDIKPENVFLTQRVGCPPVAKILDFGVSKVLASSPGAVGFSDVEVTRTGIVLGTPYYLAPEQAKGDRNLDARVDLYACGVMLYEALTGRRPFRAANYNALLIAILTSTPRPAREIRPDLPAGFSRIVEKAMDRDPAARFQTALEFQAALQPYSHGSIFPRAPAASPAVPGASRPPPAPPPPPRVPASIAAPPIPEPPQSDEDLASFVESASNDNLSLPQAPPPLPAPLSRAPAPRDAPRASASVAPPAPPAAPPPVAALQRPETKPGLGRPSTSPAPVRPLIPRPTTEGGAPRPASIPPLARPPTPPALASLWSAEDDLDEEESTQVDLPRTFDPEDRRPATPAPTGSPRRSAVDAFAPRRPAPILGPPLKPPARSDDEDESATEIMSGAVRSSLSDPGPRPAQPKRESTRPPPRPGSTRPPRR